MDVASFDELLTTTRAVRRRLDLNRPVSRDVIMQCLRIAMQAPTSSNAQDWRWLVITDPAKRAAIADIYRSIGERYLPQAALFPVAYTIGTDFTPASRPPAESVTY